MMADALVCRLMIVLMNIWWVVEKENTDQGTERFKG